MRTHLLRENAGSSEHILTRFLDIFIETRDSVSLQVCVYILKCARHISRAKE